MGIVKFNDMTSVDLGLIVQFIPSYKYPEREYETIHIPGKNGDLVLDKGSFQNVEKTYSLAKIFKKGQGFVASANAIASWLHSAKGYARLEDSYEPEYYRMAMYKSDGEMSNYYDIATVLEVTFECKPQRWLKSGEQEIQITNNYTIENPTSFDASPVIKLKTVAGQNCSITIGNNTMTLKAFDVVTDVIIDCENMECYFGNNLYNSKLVLNSGEFPVLKGNQKTTINITNATDIYIQPRWWTL